VLGNRPAAARALRTALSMRDDPKVEGDLRVAEEKPAEAIPFYEEAAARDPDSAEVRNDLGAALARVGRDDEAIHRYQEALRIDPALYDALMNLGAILARHERDALVDRLIQRPVDSKKRQELVDGYQSRKKTDQSIRAVVQLIVSMPEYQLC